MEKAIDILNIEIENMEDAYKIEKEEAFKREYSERILSCKKAIKLLKQKNCIIIYDCYEEQSLGSNPEKIAYPFTDIKLANIFISNWHKTNFNNKKCKKNEHRYYGINHWIYWLEIDTDGVLNSL